MRIYAIIFLCFGFLVWFFAGFSVSGKPVLGFIYGGTWQMISFPIAALALLVFAMSFFRKRKKVQ